MQSKVGRMDPFDLFVATYRARIRSKKWCWPFFAWSFNAAITNDWLLYKKIQGKNIPMLAFMRKFVATTLASFRKKKLPSLQCGQQELENLRTDNFDHVVIKGQSKYVLCKVCKRRSVFICQKCKVILHPSDCFKRSVTLFSQTN